MREWTSMMDARTHHQIPFKEMIASGQLALEWVLFLEAGPTPIVGSVDVDRDERMLPGLALGNTSEGAHGTERGMLTSANARSYFRCESSPQTFGQAHRGSSGRGGLDNSIERWSCLGVDVVPTWRARRMSRVDLVHTAQSIHACPSAPECRH